MGKRNENNFLIPYVLEIWNVKNRILRSATWEALADEEGFMSEKQYEIYEELAKK